MNRYGLYLIVLLSNCSTIKAEQTIRLGMSVFESQGNVSKTLIGEWLFFSFKKGPSLSSLSIINGLGVTKGTWGDLFMKNASIKTLKVDYNNGSSEIISLNKSPKLQYIPLKNINEIQWLKLTLLNAKGDILENRNKLQAVMKKYGFKNYPKEWWHFTFQAKTGKALDIPLHVNNYISRNKSLATQTHNNKFQP